MIAILNGAKIGMPRPDPIKLKLKDYINKSTFSRDYDQFAGGRMMPISYRRYPIQIMTIIKRSI